MKIGFIHMQILVQLHVNKTNLHKKGFTPGLALKQRRKATWKSPIACVAQIVTEKDELANFSGCLHAWHTRYFDGFDPTVYISVPWEYVQN